MTTPLNSILALFPPIIPARTELVDPEHYHGGIPERAVEGGLQVIIDPWLHMDIGDRVDMFWGNITAPVWTKTINFESELNNAVVFTIAEGFIRNGDATPVFYRITRKSQHPEDSQPVLTLLVKRNRPGGEDDSPEEGHDGLNYTLPDLSGGVDPGMAERGVQMRIEPYENIATYDRIIARWGSQEVIYYPVTQLQIDDPVKHPILINFTKEVIERAGDGSRVPVTYQVIDRVGNYPEARAPWAAITYVLVDLGGNRLPSPQVLMNDRPTNTIDLEQLGDKDVTARVYTDERDFAVGDKIQLAWTGTPAEGTPIIVRPLEQTVEFVPFFHDFVIPNASVQAIAKGWASVGYVRVRQGTVDRPSKNASVNVKGDVSRLQPPTVKQASGNTLPDDSPFATVSVPYYQGRRNGDLIVIHWAGTRADGGGTYHQIPVIVGDEPVGTPIERNVSTSQIAPLKGGSVNIHYVVANDDVLIYSVRESLPLNLRVGVAQAKFPPPDVIEADRNDVLLPENVSAGANVIAPLGQGDTVTGDTVGLRWTGSVSGAHPPYELTLSSFTAGKPVPFLVKPEHILPNLNGTVKLDYYVKYKDASPTGFSQERVLSIGAEQLELPPPKVLEAPDGLLDPNRYQDGFTIRVDVSALQPSDAIKLNVSGRPGDGSTVPAPQVVGSQRHIDFPVAPHITGANLGRKVNLTYTVVSQGIPSQPLDLRIGELSLPSMPTPLIEGFSEGFLHIGAIQDATKVACGQWPFQRFGLPVWLSYVESRTDGTTRSRDQFVGTPHDQGAGLSYTTEVQWLRECKADSKLAIVLKVGLFKEATVSDAVECQARVYTVRTGLDDLTTFDQFNWNGWVPNADNMSKIVLEQGEYFVQSTNGFNHLIINKSYGDIEIGEVYELSFKYQHSVATELYVYRDDTLAHRGTIPASSTWKVLSITFLSKNTSPASPMVLRFQFGGVVGHPVGSSKLDEIRLRHVP